jgi:hypothetical protein
MADGTVIQVEDINVHPQSGHILIRVKSVTTKGKSEWSGPIVGYGVDAHQFQKRFNSDIEQVKTYIKSQHLAYNGAHEALVAELGKLKGQTI